MIERARSIFYEQSPPKADQPLAETINNEQNWGCGVAWFNTLPCQGRDRGFESRRPRHFCKAKMEEKQEC